MLPLVQLLLPPRTYSHKQTDAEQRENSAAFADERSHISCECTRNSYFPHLIQQTLEMSICVVILGLICVFNLPSVTPCKDAPPKCEPALKCQRPNEEPNCGSSCDRTCRHLNDPCPIVNIVCNNSCYCKEGFARNDWGLCIEEKECAKEIKG